MTKNWSWWNCPVNQICYALTEVLHKNVGYEVIIGCVSFYIPFENTAFIGIGRRYLCRYLGKGYGRGFWHSSRDGLYRPTPVWFMRDHPKYRPNLVAFFDKQGVTVLRTLSNPINEYHYDSVPVWLRHLAWNLWMNCSLLWLNLYKVFLGRWGLQSSQLSAKHHYSFLFWRGDPRFLGRGLQVPGQSLKHLGYITGFPSYKWCLGTHLNG